MSRQSTSPRSVLVSLLTLVGLAALFALSPASSALTFALVPSAAAPTFSTGELFLMESLWYELRSLTTFNQGLAGGASSSTLFNPGADIDLTTSTDFEDLAGPAADVLEFGDQDRALLADSMSSTIFFSGVLGGAMGLTTHMILSSDFWRFI